MIVITVPPTVTACGGGWKLVVILKTNEVWPAIMGRLQKLITDTVA
jgi:hypothetical protein